MEIMKMKNRIHIFFAILLVLLFVTASCSSELDDVKPRHAIPQEDVSENDMVKILNGVYAKMESYTFSLWFNDDIQGENFATSTGITPMPDPCNMSPDNINSNINVLSYWRNSFSALYQVNYLLGMYERSANKETVAMKNIGSACYYFRAFIYYRLASHFGNVPVIRECTDEIIPISPESEVWEFVEENLAKALATASEESRWFVGKDAVNALAARTALFLGKSYEAAQYAEEVLANSAYSLVASAMDFSSIFLPDSSSKEIIFGFVNNTRTSSYCNFAGVVNDVDGNWDYSPAPECYSSLFTDDTKFQRTGDIRHFATFQSNPVNSNRVIKFSNGKQQLAKNDDYLHTPVIVSRIAEMYLISAEGKGKTEGAKRLHEFLEKRYASCLTENEIKSLPDREYQNLILDERRREFYAEGMRWQDVKRTRRYDLLKTLRDRTYLMYYPIPQAEIDIAGKEAYPQNPGY